MELKKAITLLKKGQLDQQTQPGRILLILRRNTRRFSKLKIFVFLDPSSGKRQLGLSEVVMTFILFYEPNS